MSDTVSRRGRTPAALALCAALWTLAACGTNSGGQQATTGSGPATGDVAGATANLTPYLKAKVPIPAGDAFDASSAAGKAVEVVDLTGANPAVAAVSESVRNALTGKGVTVQRCDAAGVSVNISSCINRGVVQSVKAIVVIGGDPKTYSQGVAGAKAANIPVISALDFPMPSEVEASGVDASALATDVDLVSGNAAPPDALSGTLAADFIIGDSSGKAKVLFIASPGIVGSEYVEKAFAAEMQKRCPACSTVSAGVALPSWASDLAPVVSSKLAQNPDIGYVVPVFDPMAAYTNPAIRQAGKGGSVKVVTVNGSLQQMSELAQGGLVAAEIGQSFPEMGLIAAGQALRFLTGAPPLREAAPAVRVFTRENIGSITVAATNFRTGEWYTGSPDALTQAYAKTWSK
jgi:ribose transport system substrate-binding protein